MNGDDFALERVVVSDNQERGKLDKLTKQKGLWESKEYSAMYKDREFGWMAMKAIMLTNSRMASEKINQVFAENCWTKTKATTTIRRVVSQGIVDEREVSVMGISSVGAFDWGRRGD